MEVDPVASVSFTAPLYSCQFGLIHTRIQFVGCLVMERQGTGGLVIREMGISPFQSSQIFQIWNWSDFLFSDFDSAVNVNIVFFLQAEDQRVQRVQEIFDWLQAVPGSPVLSPSQAAPSTENNFYDPRFHLWEGAGVQRQKVVDATQWLYSSIWRGGAILYI